MRVECKSVALPLMQVSFSVIVQSQPECNNMMILGCALCLISLLFMGLPTDHIALPLAGFTVLCHVKWPLYQKFLNLKSRIALLMFGFSCAYGSMFAKVWIMHRIGATENHQLAARQKDEVSAIPEEVSYCVASGIIREIQLQYKPLLSTYVEKVSHPNHKPDQLNLFTLSSFHQIFRIPIA
jgi:hypothetical protein